MNTSEISLQEATQKVVEALSHIGGSPRLFGEYAVDGTKMWTGPFITVRRLSFKPGGKLIFDYKTTREHRNLFIFADEIVSEDQLSLGEITWVDLPPSVPPSPGYGPSGANMGAVRQAAGGPGGSGPEGRHGEAGSDAPSLTIIVKKLGGGLKISLCGEDGGPGGPGGDGGSGGQGGFGGPGRQSMFGCQGGAENGGQGGQGGNGGAGGKGGNGGNGGTLTLISDASSVAAISRLLVVDLSGGKPGKAGGGGNLGAGGPGGPGGAEALPYCQGNGSNGPTGQNGQNGPQGADGSGGHVGAYYFGGLSTADIDQVLKPA
jgi:hypothetical protein